MSDLPVRRVPLDGTPESFVPTADEIKQAHELRQALEMGDNMIRAGYELAARALYTLLENPRLREAAGWESEEELWQDPVITRVVSMAVTSRMTLSLQRNRFRLKRFLKLDARFQDKVPIEDFSLLDVVDTRVQKVVQSWRGPMLEKLVESDLKPTEMAVQARRIIEADKPSEVVEKPEPVKEEEDEPPMDVTMDGRELCVNGKPIFRLVSNGSGIRLASRLLHYPRDWFSLEESGHVYHLWQDEAHEGQLLREHAATLIARPTSDEYVYAMDRARIKKAV